MKTCILLIGIGRYIELIDELIESNFGKINFNKVEFILFTDNIDIKLKSEEFFCVTKYYWADLGWPMNTLLRYRMFSSVIDYLHDKNFEIILFMNANLRMVSGNFYNVVNKLPFFFVRHPGYEGIRRYKLRNFEYRKASMAHIDYSKAFSGDYVQGTLWGGKKKNFILALRWLNESTEADLKNNMIAKVHDESYLNAYLHGVCRDFSILDSSYTWPEGWATNKKINIISINKNIVFGDNFINNLKK